MGTGSLSQRLGESFFIFENEDTVVILKQGVCLPKDFKRERERRLFRKTGSWCGVPARFRDSDELLCGLRSKERAQQRLFTRPFRVPFFPVRRGPTLTRERERERETACVSRVPKRGSLLDVWTRATRIGNDVLCNFEEPSQATAHATHFATCHACRGEFPPLPSTRRRRPSRARRQHATPSNDDAPLNRKAGTVQRQGSRLRILREVF